MDADQIIPLLVTGVLALAGGASATAIVNAIARRRVTRAEANSLAVEAADVIMVRQQDQIDRGDKERVRMESEIVALRDEVAKLREDIKDERTRCDAELDVLRQQLVDLAKNLHPPTTQGESNE